MPSEERDAGMLGGIPIRQGAANYHEFHEDILQPTHIAYPVDVARARERVVEAALAMREVVTEHMAAGVPVADYTDATKRLYEALEALDAAEGGAG